VVELREVTRETVRAVCGLGVRPEQRDYVAPNVRSIAEAYFEPRAWFRAVYAGDEPVGFLMVREDTEQNEFYLWRFMIAAEHQGKGYGRRALELLVDTIRGRGATELISSYVPGEHSPRGFYLRLGFEETVAACMGARPRSGCSCSVRSRGRLLVRRAHDPDRVTFAAEEDALDEVLVEPAGECRAAQVAGSSERRVGPSDHDALAHLMPRLGRRTSHTA